MSLNNEDQSKKRAKLLVEVKLKYAKEAAIWQETFGTEQGKKCLDLLREVYYDIDNIAHNDPTICQNRAAQRDLVRYIIKQVEYKGE